MKTRVLAVLLLCAAIALPVFAQQSSSSTPSSAATATGKPPLEYKPTDFWDGDQPGGFWLVMHAFASKGYVGRNVQMIQDRINELDGLTATNSKAIQDIDTRSQQGIQLASAKVDEANQHSMDASNKAQMAQQTANTVNGRATTVATVVGNLDQYKADSRTVIRFHPGQTVLSKQAKDALDQAAAQLKDQHGYVIEVQGFSSGAGQAGIAASRRMADSVQRYLVLNHDIPAYRIYVLAMGNAPASADGGSMQKPASRNRVEISVLKNGVDQLASSSSPK